MAMSGSTSYIAVIDDDESFGRSLGRLLRAADYQPVTYASAEAFLADTKHPRFECLLLDVALGGISGVELQRRLAAGGSTTPVIYLSAHDDTVTRTAAAETGCVAFVSKVAPSEVLLRALAGTVHGRNPPT